LKNGSYFVNFLYGDEKLNLGGVCIDGDCPLLPFKKYLKSRTVQGDVKKICMQEEYMDLGRAEKSQSSWIALLASMTLILGIGTFIY